ncbi:MAG: aminoglycoside phosphotransferase family protein [Mycobacteriales bacterium]
MPAIRPATAPRFGAPEDYGARLADADFWAPYAAAALHRHGFPAEDLTAGFSGTYPTLLAGDVVVKLFGWFPGWAESYAAERAANALVAACPGLCPAVRATGRLYDRPAPWPYLIFTRLRGTAWRDVELPPRRRYAGAADLGRALRGVHALAGSGAGLLPDWLATARPGAAARHHKWGILPPALVDEIDEFLDGFAPLAPVLVHADVTEDHVFVTPTGELDGIIDWADAMRTDPYYELGALHLGCFAGDRSLLRAFVEGYGWPVDDGFARHAMQVALMHRFDLFAGVRDLTARAGGLAELSTLLWSII